MYIYTILIVTILLVASHAAIILEAFLFNKVMCKFTECCHDDDNTGYIRYTKGPNILLKELHNKLYGQPLVIDPIYRSISAHLHENQPARPLVLYFSGWTGTGKTHVAKLIASSIYLEGMSSKYVKYISSSYHFPAKIEGHKEIQTQRLRLRDMIKGTVSSCGRSLIILDELDKLPSGVVDAIQPLVDYVDDLEGVRYNKAIFIFLSNTGASSLNKLAYKMHMDGKERKDMSSKDIEEILIQESFNEPGGLHDSSIVRRHSIGVFVGFLPLERQHVKLCIRDEIDRLGFVAEDLDKLLEDIADEMTYFPEDTRMYSKSGCKGVHDKVINYVGPQVREPIQKKNFRIDL